MACKDCAKKKSKTSTKGNPDAKQPTDSYEAMAAAALEEAARKRGILVRSSGERRQKRRELLVLGRYGHSLVDAVRSSAGVRHIDRHPPAVERSGSSEPGSDQ